ncbi:hypothetical protein [Methanogenium organophilum]|uniref:Nucleic acid binding OB-fold tRNA/helicase-type n=1 Tax=Methanogenium organophilum TaxID=2199 RepID=A0A9X9T7F6_METOG|nr:hypothetical protein [Methanogenium organophilum]WAI00356.1 hypothetical protein OU421_07905 [Methanogenium organophilum]
MDQITQTAERISRTIEERGGTPETEKIAAKLRLLINEFLIPAEDAERQVTNEVMREQQITPKREAEDKKQIAELQANDWATIEGKVVMVTAGGNPAIAQRGIIADESGAIEFVIWEKAQIPALEENAWYRIESCVTDEFRDNLNVKLHSGTNVVPVPGMSRIVSQDWHKIAERMTGTSADSSELRTIASLNPDEWVTIEGKVTKTSEGGNPAISQRGIIADATDAIEFVIWSKSELPPLEEEKWYRIESAVADSFKEKMNLKLHSGTKVTPITDTGNTVASAADEMAESLNTTSGSPDTVGEIGSAKPNDWVTVEGKIVALQPSPSPAIAQKGIIADPSGAMEFVIWEKAGAEPLEEHKWYRLENATIDEFRGAPNMKIHSGTTITPIAEDRALMPVVTPLADLTPGVACVRVKMLTNWEVRTDRMLQTGLVGDETDRMKFIIWKNRDESAEEITLEEDRVYSIYYAGVEEYNERYSLNLSGATILEEEGADIEIGSDGRNETIVGAVVHMSTGSGLIKRCRVEGCNRALSRQNFCPVHEMQQDFRYDLRITGVVDDGITATNIIMQREAVEKVTGLTLEKAIEIAENSPLGPDDVFMQFQERLMGRYISCNGPNIDGTVLVRDSDTVALVTYDQGEHAMLINRAEGQTGGDHS